MLLLPGDSHGWIPFTGATLPFWIYLPPVLYIPSTDLALPPCLAPKSFHFTLLNSILRPTNISLLYIYIFNWTGEMKWRKGGVRSGEAGTQVHSEERTTQTISVTWASHAHGYKFFKARLILINVTLQNRHQFPLASCSGTQLGILILCLKHYCSEKVRWVTEKLQNQAARVRSTPRIGSKGDWKSSTQERRGEAQMGEEGGGDVRLNRKKSGN